jgi:predicted permease
MNEFIIMLRNVLLFVALAVPGYLLVKCNVMKQEQSGVLSKVLMFLAMPFLIFSGTVNNLSFNRELLMLLLITAVIGVVYTFVMFFASKPLVGMEKDQKTNGMMRFCSVFSNNGFLGIPLAISVFGRNSHVFTVLILLNIISNVLMYTLGAYLVTGDRRTIRLKKAFFNPVLIAFLVGLVFNLLRITDRVSEIITFSDHFSNIVTPLSMTILGMKLGAIRFGNLFRSRRIYYVSFLKLIAFPSVILAILILGRAVQWTIPYDSMILGVFVAFAMPTAGLASTFADEFGGDTENAVIFTLGTTMLSILTIPCLYWILNVFI